MSFRPIPPTIPGDANLSALSISNNIASYGIYTNNTIDGVPLSIDSSGLVGITPSLVKTFPVGVTPAAIAITPDNIGYVANNNNYGISGSDSVTVLDLEAGLPLMTINDDSFNQPYTITLNGLFAYVTNSGGSTISMIDITTNTVTNTITGFDGPSGLVIKDSNNVGYVNNYGASGGVGSGNGTTVSIVDMNALTITGTITVGLAPAAMALTPDQRYLYVALYETGATNSGIVKVYDTNNNNTLVATINNFSGPFAIAMNPNGLKAYVTNFGSNNFVPYGTTVSVIDIPTNTITNTITTGIQPSGAAVSPNGKYLYITNYNSLYSTYNLPVNSPGTGTVTISNLIPGAGTVSIIDTETETLVAPTVKVDQSPSAVAIDSLGKFAYVTNYGSNTVSGIYINQGLSFSGLGPI
jgi:YVTN family beta-propeller protein